MKYLLIMAILFSSSESKVIFEFNNTSSLQNWIIVDDVVMGGESSGSFKLNAEGKGVFSGAISLDNNGGFSSVRYRFPKTKTKDFSKIALRIQGDGKDYQFRIKSNSQDYYSYIKPFSTSGEWEVVEIFLKDMYPSFRGRTVDLPNFSNDAMEEVTFLIGNKKKESFKLLIDKIELKK